MKITVTQEDIEKGKRGCRNCPIALATNRTTLLDAAVYPHCIISVDMGTVWVLPKKAQQFIQRFDDGKPVHPFTFDIELP